MEPTQDRITKKEQVESFEEAVRLLVIGMVHGHVKDMPIAKRMAIKRYMKTYVNALDVFELKDIKKGLEAGQSPEELYFKMEQAEKGYDRFMARRRSKYWPEF